MPEIIKYGIGRDYLPDWDQEEALREIYQNFNDYGEFDKELDRGSSVWTTVLSNNFEPNNLEFLKVGMSGKRGNSSTVGEHGEGLKMAMLVLCREDLCCEIETAGYSITPTFVEDEYLGEVFAVIIEDALTTGFSIKFECDKEYACEYEENTILKEEDIVFDDNHYGRIIRREPGTIYCGGIKVCVLEGFKYAYDFNPEYLTLDRDRSIPREYEVESRAASIVSSYNAKVNPVVKVRDLSNREYNKAYKLPESVASKFNPVRKAGKLVFEYKGETAPEHIANALIKSKSLEKKIVKATIGLTRKRNPAKMLEEFQEKYSCIISSYKNMELDLKALIEKSKQWRNK